MERWNCEVTQPSSRSRTNSCLMHRFYLPPEDCQSPLLALRDREAHHASQVLRVAPGDQVVVLDGAGQQIACEVKDTRRDQVSLRVLQRNSFPPLPCQITLLQAVPKAKLIEDIIQKATELGVHRIVPLLTERVVTHLSDAGAEAKAAKWQLTAIEAIKQCGNPWLPRIEVPTTPQSFLARHESFDLSLIGALLEDRRYPREWIEQFVREHQRRPRTVSIWIGPEGDFTPAELALAKSSGARPISLGRLVLRCETAAIYCLSILNYELQVPVE